MRLARPDAASNANGTIVPSVETTKKCRPERLQALWCVPDGVR
jgi:hypothetical protein